MLSVTVYLLLILLLILWIESDQRLGPNLLIIKRNAAEELEDWLKRFSWEKSREPLTQGELPQYKFYTEVVDLLLSLARKVGGTYQDSLLFLRQGLQSDRQFEKKLKEALWGTWLQMGLMVALTWIFILSSLSLVDIKVSSFKLILIGLWQMIGLLILPWLLRVLRMRYFGDIGILWRILYVLRSLSKVPLSRTEIMTIANVGLIKTIKQKTLSPLVDKLKQTCQKALQQGGSYEEEVVSLMEELRFQEKWHFELFEKRLMVIKLGLMSIFFLPSYLTFIFCLLGDLLTLM